MANILMLLGMFASRIASALLIVAIRARSNAAACLMNRLLWSSSVITFSKYDASPVQMKKNDAAELAILSESESRKGSILSRTWQALKVVNVSMRASMGLLMSCLSR